MRRIILVIAVIALIAALGTWVLRTVANIAGLPREAYASDWTAAFIIEHVRTTGAWPNGWQDLRDDYDRLAVPEFYAWTFEELQNLIDVNWNMTVDEIRDSSKPIDAIRLRSGHDVSYSGDPDELIFDYIHTGNDPHQIHQRIGDHGEQSHATEPAVGSALTSTRIAPAR